MNRFLILVCLIAVACAKAGDRSPSSTSTEPASAPTGQAASAPAQQARSEAQAETSTPAAPGDAVEASAEAGPKPCASTAECPEGLVCTVESGACNPPPGCKEGEICPQVCYGVCDEVALPPKGAAVECIRNDDCRAFSNYCGGCACDGLSVDVADPKCPDDPVNCAVDPCEGKEVRCVDGECTVVAADS